MTYHIFHLEPYAKSVMKTLMLGIYMLLLRHFNMCNAAMDTQLLLISININMICKVKADSRSSQGLIVTMIDWIGAALL